MPLEASIAQLRKKATEFFKFFKKFLKITFFHCFKGFLQILEDIVNMFRADGQPDGVGPNALIRLFLRA